MVFGPTPRKRLAMAKDDVARGVREMVRSVLREKGVKHKTKFETIFTVCYAQYPFDCVEYIGPLQFDLDKTIIHGCVWGQAAFSYNDDKIQSWIAEKIFNFMRMNHQDILIRERFDIMSPECDKQLGEFIDKHVKNIHKRPASFKRLIKRMGSHERYMPDIPFEEWRLSWWGRIKRLLGIVFGKGIEIDDVYWINSIQRHFKLTKTEADEVYQTVLAMRWHNQSKKEVENVTEQIVEK